MVLTEDRVREIAAEVFHEYIEILPGSDDELVEDRRPGVCEWFGGAVQLALDDLFAAIPAEAWALLEEGWQHYCSLYSERTGACTEEQSWRAFTLAQARMNTLHLWSRESAAAFAAFVPLAYGLAGTCNAPPQMTRADEWRHIDPVEGDPSKQPSHR